MQPAYGQLITYDKKVFQPLDVLTNVFCSSGQILEDGSFIAIGGTTNDPAIKLMNGAADIRKFVPCNATPNKTCGFVDAGEMTSKRWYPTSEKLPDGRVMVVGGGDVVGLLAVNNYMVNNPTWEFWPRKENEGRLFHNLSSHLESRSRAGGRFLSITIRCPFNQLKSSRVPCCMAHSKGESLCVLCTLTHRLGA